MHAMHAMRMCVTPSAHSHTRGDISTTISFTTTQKVALSTSKTVGSAFSAAFSVLPKFGPVSLPEYSFEKGWSKSETTTNTVTKTADTTIETTPKLNINPKETAALYMMMCALALANAACSAASYAARGATLHMVAMHAHYLDRRRLVGMCSSSAQVCCSMLPTFRMQLTALHDLQYPLQVQRLSFHALEGSRQAEAGRRINGL